MTILHEALFGHHLTYRLLAFGKKKWSCLRVSNEAVCSSSGVTKGISNEKFRFLFVLSVVSWSPTKHKNFSVARLLAARHVRFVNAYSKIWPFKTWHGSFTKFSFRKQNTLSSLAGETSFVKISSSFSNYLRSRNITTYPWVFVWTEIQACLSAGMTFKYERWKSRDGVILLFSSPAGGPAFCSGAQGCIYGHEYSVQNGYKTLLPRSSKLPSICEQKS